MSGEGKLERMEVDYSSTVDEKIPECAQLAKTGKLNDAIDVLMALEKQTRTGSDAISTGRLLVAIVKMCFEAKKWDLLNEQIVLLTKRRGQLKQAVTKMVQEAYGYVEKTPNMEVKLKLIATLRTVTDGKIYVEIERARLTRTLAKLKEEQGAVTEAANILQELQVETFGSMDKKEKVEFILEQMRLCLAKKDFVRTQIISKKISTKYFANESTQDLKLKFYQLMIELDQHEGAYLQICKHYRAVVDTPSVREDKEKHNQALKFVVMYLILAPYDNEQCDLLQRVKETEQMDDLPIYMELLKLFTTSEIMRWKDLCQKYQQELQAIAPGNQVFNPKAEDGIKRWKDLKARVVEHNIRVMAKYYTRITMKRMATLLDLTKAETEDFLSALVVNKTIQAKIDRLAGIIHFQRTKDPNDILNDWSFNINSLMCLLNKTTHLITKEEMIHKLY